VIRVFGVELYDAPCSHRGLLPCGSLYGLAERIAEGERIHLETEDVVNAWKERERAAEPDSALELTGERQGAGVPIPRGP